MTLLAGFKVVQIGGGLAAAVCGRVLADVGAQVTCIDPGAGTVLSDTLDRGKGVAATEEEQRERLAGAHLIVREGQPKEWAESPYDRAGLRRINASAIVVTISPFGETGPAGRRSGDRPHFVLRQRHRAPADRPGGRSVGGADPSGGRAIGVHRRAGGRLRRHAGGARPSARCVDRCVDPRSPGDARHDRACPRGPRPHELGPQAPQRRQWRHGHDPAGARRLRRDLAAGGEAVDGVAESDGIAGLGRRPALRHQGPAGEELG